MAGTVHARAEIARFARALCKHHHERARGALASGMCGTADQDRGSLVSPLRCAGPRVVLGFRARNRWVTTGLLICPAVPARGSARASARSSARCQGLSRHLTDLWQRRPSAMHGTEYVCRPCYTDRQRSPQPGHSSGCAAGSGASFSADPRTRRAFSALPGRVG